MTARRRWLPHPTMTVVLIVTWMLLHSSVEPAHWLLAVILGLVVPLFTQRFWPEPVRFGDVIRVTRFVALVLWDIVVANITIAPVILGPRSAIKPGFVWVPVDLDDDFALTALASTISLTPGTVSAEVSMDRRYLLVHALIVEDEDELIDTIKRRYETPIKEIFRC